ncbi:LysR substrate-binding domain-containing protein [Paraburkholderia caledonica]|uniref:LysR substrate-binding domain-containing protein n=1 Tax=Paraburkholderia caledonica TaxID=134536 RepID=UPI003709B8AB
MAVSRNASLPAKPISGGGGCRQPARLSPYAAAVHRALPVGGAHRHPRLGRGRVTLDAFLAEDHALVSNRGCVPGVVDKPLAALGRSRRVVLTFPDFLVAPAVVARTDLVMTVPECIARGYAESHTLRLFKPPVNVAPFDVVFTWPARSVADPAMQ